VGVGGFAVIVEQESASDASVHGLDDGAKWLFNISDATSAYYWVPIERQYEQRASGD
jgi:hypothetical protein